MKRFLRSLSPLLLVALIGCETLKQVNWAAVAQTAVQLGAMFLLKGNPEYRSEIGLASSLLNTFIKGKSVEVNAVQAAVGKSLDPKIAAVIAAGIDEIAPAVAAAAEQNKATVLAQGLNALLSGLNAALNEPTAPAAAPPGIRQRAVQALAKRGIDVN